MAEPLLAAGGLAAFDAAVGKLLAKLFPDQCDEFSKVYMEFAVCGRKRQPQRHREGGPCHHGEHGGHGEKTRITEEKQKSISVISVSSVVISLLCVFVSLWWTQPTPTPNSRSRPRVRFKLAELSFQLPLQARFFAAIEKLLA